MAIPPDPSPTFLQLDISGLFQLAGATIAILLFSFLLVDLFDTAGTLIAVAHQAKMLDENGNLPRLGPALVADSSATVFGSLMGTSTTTSYIESSSGVRAGASISKRRRRTSCSRSADHQTCAASRRARPRPC